MRDEKRGLNLASASGSTGHRKGCENKGCGNPLRHTRTLMLLRFSGLRG